MRVRQKEGECPGCDGPGEIGAPCSERACSFRGYHHIPRSFAEALSEDGSPSPVIGRMVEDYLVVAELGSGGFGTVYLGLQRPRFKLRAAVKLLNKGQLDPKQARRYEAKFQSEGDALAMLAHPNIVRLYQHGVCEGIPFLVMEFVEGGRALRDLLKDLADDRVMSIGDIRRILEQLCNGLASAHAQGIIHRDIKPENIMLQQVEGDPNYVRILDFGLAKFVQEGTQTSVAMGTPVYMAPEQFEMRNLGPWTDIYSVAYIAYELLTRINPLAGLSQEELIRRKLLARPDYIDEGKLTPSAVPFFHKALAHDPGARYRSVGDFRDDMLAMFDEVEAIFDRKRSAPPAPAPAPTPQSRQLTRDDHVALAEEFRSGLHGGENNLQVLSAMVDVALDRTDAIHGLVFGLDGPTSSTANRPGAPLQGVPVTQYGVAQEAPSGWWDNLAMGIARITSSTGKAFRSVDLATREPPLEGASESGLRSALCMPLIAQDGEGFLIYLAAKAPGAFSHQTERLFEQLGRWALEQVSPPPQVASPAPPPEPEPARVSVSADDIVAKAGLHPPRSPTAPDQAAGGLQAPTGGAEPEPPASVEVMEEAFEPERQPSDLERLYDAEQVRSMPFNSLPTDVRAKLVAHLNWERLPGPLFHHMHQETKSNPLTLIIVGLIAGALLLLKAWYSGDMVQQPGALHSAKWLVVYIPLAVIMIASLIKAISIYFSNRRLPYEPGRYVFALDAIELDDDEITILPRSMMGEISARVDESPMGSSRLRLSIARKDSPEVFHALSPTNEPQAAMNRYARARKEAVEALESGDQRTLETFDPFMMLRLNGWDLSGGEGTGGQPRVRFTRPRAGAWPLLASGRGLGRGRGTWHYRNRLLDEAMFSYAREKNTPMALGSYIDQKGARYVEEVRARFLPLALAKKDRTISGVAKVIVSLGKLKKDLPHRAAYIDESIVLIKQLRLKAAVKKKSVKELRELKKHLPDLTPACNKAIGALYQAALEKLKLHLSDRDPSLVAWFSRLFAWLSKHDTNELLIRFKPPTMKSLLLADRYLSRKMSTHAPIAPHFSDSQNKGRERLMLTKGLADTFGKIVHKEILTLRRGQRFQEEKPDYGSQSRPTIYVEYDVKPSGRIYRGRTSATTYAGITISFAVALSLPGEKETVSYSLEVEPPKEFKVSTASTHYGASLGPSAGNVYEEMSTRAFELLVAEMKRKLFR